MAIRRTWLTILMLTSALLVAGAVPQRVAWAEPAEAPSVESIKKSLDEIEQALGGDDIKADTLAGFRQTLNSALDALRAKIEDLEPRIRDVQERLQQLGPAPAKDAPAESREIADQRRELTTEFSDLDGELKQARVLSVRIDQLSDRIAQKRHALYANELLARTSSVLDPYFWLDAFNALPVELRSARALLETLNQRGDYLRWATAALAIIAIIALAIVLDRWWVPRFLAVPSSTRSAKAWKSLCVFVWLAVRTPVASFAALSVLSLLGLLTFRLEQIGEGVVAGIAAASVWPRRRARDVCADGTGPPAGAGGRRDRAVLLPSPRLAVPCARGAGRLASHPQDAVRPAHHYGRHQCPVCSGNGRVPG